MVNEAPNPPNWAKVPIVEETLRLYTESQEHNKIVAEKFTSAFPRLEQLAKAAFTDSLTGLLSQGAFNVRQEIHLTTPEAQFVVVFIDAADFKRINTEFTIRGGDAALRQIGKLLLAFEKGFGSISYRRGGDEFVVLVPPAELDVFLFSCENRLAKLPCTFQAKEFVISCNTGYARPDGAVASLKTLCDRAEDACKYQKYNGLTVPLKWSEDIETEVPETLRARCFRCGSTCSVSVTKASKKDDCLKRCSNCGEEFGKPAATPA